MAKAEGIPPTASVASVGPGIRYIGNWAYAFSGDITDAGSGSAATTLLDFTSGTGLIVARFNWVAAVNANTDIYLDLLFNSESVYKGFSDQEPFRGGVLALSGKNCSRRTPPVIVNTVSGLLLDLLGPT